MVCSWKEDDSFAPSMVDKMVSRMDDTSSMLRLRLPGGLRPVGGAEHK